MTKRGCFSSTPAMLLLSACAVAALPAAVLLTAARARAQTAVPAHLPPKGLVVLWSAEGSAKDGAGKNHGTLKGGTAFVPGRMGKAFTFDGKDDHIALGDVLDWGKGSWSMSLWLRRSASCAKDAALLRKGLTAYGTPKESGYGLDIVDNRLRFSLAGANQSHAFETWAPGPKAAEWHHVAGVLNRKTGRMILYVDGKAADTASIAKLGSLDTNMPLSIGMLDRGRTAPMYWHFTGAIDEVAMWNRALSAEEIRGVHAASRFAAHPVAKGLVGLWLGDGNVTDRLGRHHGKANAGVAYTADRHGKAKGALLFDGKGGRVTVPDHDQLDTDDAFTLSTWVRPNRLDGHVQILSKWVYTQAGNGDYILNIAPDGRPGLYVAFREKSHVEDILKAKSAIPTAGAWTHVAATFDRGRICIYINGKLDATKTSASVKHTSRKEYEHDYISIGAKWDGNLSLDGAMDEVAIWNRALSAEEIAQVARARSLTGLLTTTVPYVDRDALSDRVVLAGGKVLTGTILNEAYELTAFFGKIKLPAGRVAGLVRAGPGSAALWVLLTDGQAVSGRPASAVVRLRPPGASAGAEPLSIPLADIRQCAYRITAAKPAVARAPGPMVHLRDGHRLCLAVKGSPNLLLQTPYGKLDLSTGALVRLDPVAGKGSLRRAVLAGGSVISGTLATDRLALKLALGLSATVRRDDIVRIVIAETPARPADAAVMVMRNGDRLAGRLAGEELTVRTRFGKTKIHRVSVLAMVFDAARPGAVTMKLWDGSSLDAVLVEATLTFVAAGSGPTVKVKPAHIASITRPYALPGPETLVKVKKLIAKLGAESYADREAATKELLKMGKGIVPLLKKHLTSPDPEVRQRIEGILEKSEPKKAEPVPSPDIGPRTRTLILHRK